MARLKATLVCKKLHEKPTTLEKIEVCGHLNVACPKGQIRTEENLLCKAGWEAAVFIVLEQSDCRPAALRHSGLWGQ